MVYCGKPSASCGQCRLRRIKCDLIRPKCTPCIRTGRDCSGYRNTAELMFRDETTTTVAKHQKRQKPRWKTDPITAVTAVTILTDAPREPDTDLSHKRQSHSPPRRQQRAKESIRCLDQSISDIAVNLLLTKYVRGSHFEFLPLLCRASTFGKPFRSALESVALARFANDSNLPGMSELAWTRYNLALFETRRTLEDAETAASDDTIATVLLLSSFEAISVDVNASTRCWTKHVRGAYAILTVRGRELLHTNVGRQMFRQIATSITLDCLQTRKRMPGPLLELMSSLRDGRSVTDPFHRIQIIAEDFIDLRASIEEGKITNLFQVISIAEDIDAQTQDLASDMQYQKASSYETVDQADTADTDIRPRERSFHQRSQLAVTQLWDSIRMLRILLNETIYDTSLHLFKSQSCTFAIDEFPPLLIGASKNSKTIAIICREICESISVPHSTSTDSKHHYDLDNLSQHQDAVSAVNYLIWPLFKAGSCRHASRHVREYAARQLRELGTNHRVRRAVIAAEQLESGLYSDSWMHVSHMF